MSAARSKWRAASKGRGRPGEGLPRWKACAIITPFLGLTALLLWLGLAIVVRCDRMYEGRVDVTLERRFLGWLAVSTETVPDVVKADIVVVRAGPSASASRVGSTVKLRLTTGAGQVHLRTRFGPAFGTQPRDMAAQIEQFLEQPSKPSLATWWMPWVVNVGAIPFVLALGAIVGEVLLRALGFFKPPALEG